MQDEVMQCAYVLECMKDKCISDKCEMNVCKQGACKMHTSHIQYMFLLYRHPKSDVITGMKL